jgi:hypothetical protein
MKTREGLVDAVAKEETSIEDGDRRRFRSYDLTVDIHTN